MSGVDSHNDMAVRLVREIVQATAGASMPTTETLVLLESVLAGVIWAAVKPEGRDVTIDVMVRRVRKRLVLLDAMKSTPAGAS